MSKEAALEILQSARGSQFDDELVGYFLVLAEQGALEHLLGHSDDGIPLQICPMCGPTLVIQRGYLAGRHIYCRSCSGQFTLVPTAKGLQAESTGVTGDAKDLEPALDADLIRRMVAQAAEHLAAQDLLEGLVFDEAQRHAA